MTSQEYLRLLEIANEMENSVKEFREALQQYGVSLSIKSDILDLSENSHRLLLDLEKEIECSNTSKTSL